MPYTQPTLADARIALASRLQDEGMVHWVTAELTVYLREALRTWNALTAHWRNRASFSTVINQPFYDLPTELPTLRGYTVTQWELVADLQYALMEPAAPGGTWTGTDQFTLEQLVNAIRGTRDQFYRETGCVVTRSTTAVAAPPASGRQVLDEAVDLVRRVAWRVDATALLLPCLRSDEWASSHYQPAWPTSTDPPTSYSVTAVPPLELQLFPAPTTAGLLDLVTINSGPALDPLVDATLSVPADFAWVIKFGALAQLLSQDGLQFDPGRAAYCEARWLQGLQLAARAPVVVNALIGTSPVLTTSLSEVDTYNPLWQQLTGTPRELILAGGNLLGTVPPAGGGGPFTITLDVVQNAPVPSADSDILQISQDVYDSILDYAEHLALFKQGPGQVDAANALLERFGAAAGVELGVQQASQPMRTPALRQQVQDESALVRESMPIPV